MYCVKCGEKFADNLRYCPNCSAKVGDTISENEVLGQTPEETKRKRNSFLYKWPIIAECVFVLGTLFAFFGGRYISGLIGLGSVGLGAVVILTRMGIIKTKRRWFSVLLLGIAFALIPLYLRFFWFDMSTYKTYDWNDVKLEEMLPTPPTKFGVIITNEDDKLDLLLRHVEKEEFDQYVKDCKEIGFNIECSDGALDTGRFYSYSFVGYNENGYMVTIRFSNRTGYEGIEIVLKEEDYREEPESEYYTVNGQKFPILEYDLNP